MKKLLLILALFVVGCSDSSEPEKPITTKKQDTTYKFKVEGVCSDLQNAYESSYLVFISLHPNVLDKVFINVRDYAKIEYEGEELKKKDLERYSLLEETYYETIDVTMNYQSPLVYITEMTQEIFEKDNWNVKSIHGYESMGYYEGDGGYFYVKGSCQLKVLERDILDGSFLNNRKLEY
tara:strand:- start:261 stop:797 length:537 start_codon:yes stop_codon:yes gene_type:complete